MSTVKKQYRLDTLTLAYIDALVQQSDSCVTATDVVKRAIAAYAFQNLSDFDEIVKDHAYKQTV